MSPMYAIEAIEVSKTYGKKKVLDKINLKVSKGELIGLFGPNGAGKTTLLRILSGQLEPDTGAVTTGGVPHTDPIKLKHGVGVVPEAETPPTFLTAQETLELTCMIRHQSDIEVKVSRWIEFFDLEDQSDVLCRDLSKGEHQKVMLAGAFIHEPEILLLDEPFINLDPIYQRKLREYLLELTSMGRTIFMCTHILEIAERLCGRVAFIHKGRIVEQGSIDEVRHGASLEEAFIGAVGCEPCA